MKSILCSDYVSYEEVMEQDNIFVITNGIGTFFMCFDYYAPKEAKIWYKFSIDPFDIDFLTFKRLDYGIITDDIFSTKGLNTAFKYFKSCKDEFIYKNTNILKEVFFRGGKISNSIKNIKEKYWVRKKISKEDYYGVLNVDRVYRMRSRLTNCVKTWLARIYKEYNFMDNSIDYIKEYYDKWVVMVQMIQTQKESMIQPLWKFIASNDIHSFEEFYCAWKKVYDENIHIRGINKKGVEELYYLIINIRSFILSKD